MSFVSVLRKTGDALTATGQLVSNVSRLGMRESLRRLTRGVYASALPSPLSEKLHGRAHRSSEDAQFRNYGRNLHNVTRQLVSESDLAARLVDLTELKTFGPHGARPQFRTGHASFDAALEEAWQDWAHCVTPQGDSWRQLMSMWVRELVSPGEAFSICFVDDRGDFCIQPMESEQLWAGFQPRGTNRSISEGIEYDEHGRPTRYLFSKHDPVMPDGFGEYVEVDAARVVHIFNRQRPTQSRGLPPFLQSLITLHQINEADRQELGSIRATSAFGIHVRTGDPPADYLTGMGATPGAMTAAERALYDQEVESRVEFFDGGAVNVGDFEAKTLDANRPGTQYKPFTEALTAKVAARHGHSYAELTGDYSKSNYSSARLSVLDNLDSHIRNQQIVFERGCSVVIRHLVPYWIATGQIKVPKAVKTERIAKIERCVEWLGRGYNHVDPQKEADALESLIDLGIETWESALIKQGRDPEEVAASIDRTRKLGEKYNLDLPLPIRDRGTKSTDQDAEALAPDDAATAKS